MNRRLALCTSAVAMAWIVASAGAAAQSYPTRPVKIIAPYSAGAGPAVFTHVVAEKLAKAWGQPVVVDARPTDMSCWS